MPSIHHLTRQGSAVVLASFLVVSSSRATANEPDAREVAKRWRERQPLRLEELRRAWAERPDAVRSALRERLQEGRQDRSLATRRAGVPGLAERFHAGGLATIDPRPLNALLDPLGTFEDEAGEEPPVGSLPRLFLADFDGDGDLDAFVGDKYGYVRYLRNDGGAGNEPEFVELTGAASPTGSLDLSKGGGSTFGPSAPTLVDIDGDDDLDLFVGHGFADGDSLGGRVLFFENVGGVLTRNDAGNPLAGFVFGDGFATPTFVDIDGDDDFDAFVGTKVDPGGSGEVYFLRNDGDENNPDFLDETDTGTDPFAGKSFPPFTAPYFADVDGDDDPDGFVGSFYTTRAFRNDTVLPGTPVFVEQTGYEHPFGGAPMFTPGPVLADVDGDGDLDAFVGLGYYKDLPFGFIQYFENTGSPTDSSFLAPGDRLELVDVDGDGDLDALVSRFGSPISPDALPGAAAVISGKGEPLPPPLAVWYFRNLGTLDEPVWELQSGTDNPFLTFNTGYVGSYGGSYSLPSVAPTVGHLDGDALLDAFVGRPDGYLEFLEDDGTGQLDPAATHPLEIFDFGSGPDPHLADLTGDGELDLVVGHEVDSDPYYSSYVSFFLNPTGPAGIEAPQDLVLDFTDTGLDRPAPTLADVDGDGDLDLLVGGYYYGEDYLYGLTLFVENTGTPTAPAFDVASALPVEALIDFTTSPALGDVNADGALDLFLGNPSGAEMFLTAVPNLQVTKEITGGDLQQDGSVEYTVTVTNVGTGTQPDDPDDPELTDTLPPELTLVSAVVASGPGAVSISGNTVSWDGALDPGESVSIVITADIAPGTLGQTIENQAVAFLDTDDDGDNDAERPSDDPATPAAADPTAFAVGAQSVLEIPTLAQWGKALFAGLLSLLGFFGLRRFNG